MAGGKIDILVEPNTKGFNRALESSLGSALGIAGNSAPVSASPSALAALPAISFLSAPNTKAN